MYGGRPVGKHLFALMWPAHSFLDQTLLRPPQRIWVTKDAADRIRVELDRAGVRMPLADRAQISLTGELLDGGSPFGKSQSPAHFRCPRLSSIPAAEPQKTELIPATPYDSRMTVTGKTAKMLRKRVERVKGIEPSSLFHL